MGVSVREKVPGSGLWWLFINHHGRRRSKMIGRDKRQATQLAKLVEKKIAAGDLGILDKKTVGDLNHYIGLWLGGSARVTLKQSTLDGYYGIWKKHI